MTTEYLELEEALETDRYLVIGLDKHRAWLSMKVHLRDERDRIEKRMLRSLRGNQAVNQRNVDFARGELKMIDFMLGIVPKMKAREEARDAES